VPARISITQELPESAQPALRPTSRDAFRLARRTWRKGERLDMSALARELGVNRATLYRWCGSREQLLVEVIWNLSHHQLEDIAAKVKAGGAERVIQVVELFIERTIAHTGMQAWLAKEGDFAMRLLTRYDGGFQPRLVAWLEGLLQDEVDVGGLELPAEVHEVAYVLEQLIESYVYRYPITGEQPRARRAEPILRMLLR
jgi:AcrR family transcriptional regulator